MISLVNVTKSQFTADLVTFTQEILNGKLHFLCNVCSGQDDSKTMVDKRSLSIKQYGRKQK